MSTFYEIPLNLEDKEFKELNPEQSFEKVYYNINSAFMIFSENDVDEDILDAWYKDTDTSMVQAISKLSEEEIYFLDSHLALVDFLIPSHGKSLHPKELPSAWDAAQELIAFYNDVYKDNKDKQNNVKSAQKYLNSLQDQHLN